MQEQQIASDIANSGIIGIVIIVVTLFLYFLPPFIAYRRKHNAFTGILIIDIFFGWTFIGWILCLVWAYGTNTAGNFPNRERV